MTDKASYIRGRILDRKIGSCKDITPDQMEIISILSMEHDEYERIKKGRVKADIHAGEEIVPHVNKIAEAAKERLIKNNLLIIALKDESSVPKVFYKGEEIKFKTNISFDWETDTDMPGSLTYAIEHYERGNGFPVRQRIERHIKGNA